MMVAILLTFVGSAAAWGTSANVAAVSDEGFYANNVYSGNMGYVYYSDYPDQTFTSFAPADVNAANLASYDTLFLFASDPSLFNAQQKADIVAFVQNGGKLIIWDSEDPYYDGSWDYTWLPTPFATAVPGAMGASGTLVIVEENMLSSNNVASQFYIDAATLGSSTDAVGDANVFTSFVPSQWCVDMTATNYLQITGPTHVYSKSLGSGLIIYCGLDWDYAGYYTGFGGGYGDELKKMLMFELDANNLPCGSVPPTSLTVTKVADKTKYQVGDPVTFTISVTNPSGQYTASNVGLVEYPPAEVTLSTMTANLGDLAPGQSASCTFTGTADEDGCDLENSVVATGYYSGLPVFSGGDTAVFDIGDSCNGIPSPEFPSLALPVAMVMGMVFIVYSMKRKEE